MTKWFDKGKEHHVKSMKALGELFGRRATIGDSMISDASDARSFVVESLIKPDDHSERVLNDLCQESGYQSE